MPIVSSFFYEYITKRKGKTDLYSTFCDGILYDHMQMIDKFVEVSIPYFVGWAWKDTIYFNINEKASSYLAGEHVKCASDKFWTIYIFFKIIK